MISRRDITAKEARAIMGLRDAGASTRGIVAGLADAGIVMSQSTVCRWLQNQNRVTVPTEDTIKQLKKLRTAAQSKKYLNCGVKPDIDSATKILSLTDLHIPFQFNDVIEHAITNHSDADTVVLGGDILEVYALSKWLKSKHIPFREEFKIAGELIDKLSRAFPRIVVIRGNHENRAIAHFQSLLDPDVLPMLDYDIMTSLCKGFSFDDNDGFVKKYDWNNVHYRGGPQGWFQQIGHCIFAHPSNASGAQFAALHTVIGACNWFRNRGYEFDAVVCGHSHKMGSAIWNGKLVLEQGCCCMPMDYEAHPKLMYKSPQTFGYAVVHMDKKGRVDFGKTRNIYRGSGTLDPGKAMEVMV